MKRKIFILSFIIFVLGFSLVLFSCKPKKPKPNPNPDVPVIVNEGEVKVTFDIGENATFEAQKQRAVKKDTNFKEKKVPTKTGYTFKAWLVDGKEITFPYKVEKEVIFKAKYEANTYKVTYVGLDNKKYSEFKFDSDYTLITVENDKPGRRFDCWYKDAELKEKIENTGKWTIANDIKLYGKYIDEFYQITLDPQGGTLAQEQLVQRVKPNDTINLPNPTREVEAAYTFLGWYKEKTFTTKVETGTKWTGKEDITLYAKWQKNKFTLSFDVKHGAAISILELSYDDKVTLPTPTAEGYKFIAWYSDQELKTEFKFDGTWKIAKDTVLYAKWEANEYQITFETNGGNSIDPLKIKYDANLELPTPEKGVPGGYVFIGWYLEDTFTTKVENSVWKTLNDITLYAKWQKSRFTVSFDLLGKATPPNDITVTYDDPVSLEVLTIKGYDFLGWYKEETFENLVENEILNWNIVGDITLYANLKEKQYSVVWETNGGSNIDTTTVEFNGKISKPADPTKKGYIFQGWFTNSGLSQEMDFDTYTMPAEDITLYADWKAMNITITFFYPASATEPEHKEVINTTYDAEVETPKNNQVHTGGLSHMLFGWYVYDTNGNKLKDPNKPDKDWFISTNSKFKVIATQDLVIRPYIT